MVHGKIVTAEWKNESESGRIGSGESHSLPVSTQALLFFPSAVKIAPLTYFALAERLEEAVLSPDKLLIKALMQTTSVTTTNIFFESIVGLFISKEESRDKMNAITCHIYT